MPIPEIVGIAQAKARLSELVRQAKAGKTFEVINRSEAMAIIIGVEHYKALLERIEDLEDGLAILQGKLASEGKANIAWEQAQAEYWAEHPQEGVGV